MLYEKIISVHNALGVLADKVNKEEWALIHLARKELFDAAKIAAEMEERFMITNNYKGEKND